MRYDTVSTLPNDTCNDMQLSSVLAARVCVCACVRACMRACACVCVRACVRAYCSDTGCKGCGSGGHTLVRQYVCSIRIPKYRIVFT